MYDTQEVEVKPGVYRDAVLCLDCMTPNLVDTGAEACPECGSTGTLAWQKDHQHREDTEND